MSAGRFITATGTGIGKTLVTAALAHQLRHKGMHVRAIKPLVTGLTAETREESDPAILLAAQGRPLTDESIAEIAPFRYAAPLAPSMAAAMEGKRVDMRALISYCRRATDGTEMLLIEGVGGVMSPVAALHTNLDMIAGLKATTLLVAGNHLGGISHTLTAVEAMRARGIDPAAIVLNESAGVQPPLEGTMASLQRFLPDAQIISIARNMIPTALLALAD